MRVESYAKTGAALHGASEACEAGGTCDSQVPSAGRTSSAADKETGDRETAPLYTLVPGGDGLPVYRMKPGVVGILLATYNGERYLEEQLDSINRQSRREFVCLIHDDGSTDGTRELAARYCAAHAHHFACMDGAPTGGAKYNFMYMLRCVRADYVMFSDQDDVWLPDKIERTLRKMKETEENYPTCIYTDLRVVDADLNVIDESFWHYGSKNPADNTVRKLLYGNVAAGCTMMINAALRDVAMHLYPAEERDEADGNASDLQVAVQDAGRDRNGAGASVRSDQKGLDIQRGRGSADSSTSPKMTRTDPADNITMHDAFLALLASACGRIAYLTEPTILYRQHGDNEIGARPGVTLREKLAKLLDLRALLEPKRAFLDDKQRHIQAALDTLEAARPEDNANETARPGDKNRITIARSGDDSAARPAGQASDTSRPYAYNAHYPENRRIIERNLKMHTLPLPLRILCYYAWR